MGDVLCQHEAGDEMMHWPSLPAVRAQDKRIEPSISDGDTNNRIQTV